MPVVVVSHICLLASSIFLSNHNPGLDELKVNPRKSGKSAAKIKIMALPLVTQFVCEQ